MPKLANFCHKDIAKFLRENGFIIERQDSASHQQWYNEKTGALVTVAYHGSKATYAPATLDSIIRQSDISKKKWREWGFSK